MNETELQQRASQLVQREVNCCLSYLVSTLAGGYGALPSKRYGMVNSAEELGALAEQACELAAPIDDYEEAAIQAGFSPSATHPGMWSNETATFKEGESPMFWESAAEACGEQDIDPYQRDVYEHWSVSDWLADNLIAKGEKVDKDFASLCVWARTTTGQAISMDAVIRAIVTDLHKAG